MLTIFFFNVEKGHIECYRSCKTPGGTALIFASLSKLQYPLSGGQLETVDLLTEPKACQSRCPPPCSHVTEHGYYVFLSDDQRLPTPSITDLSDSSYLLKDATGNFHAIFERYFTAPLAFYTCSPRSIRLIIYQ